MTRRDRLIGWLCARLGAHVRGQCGCPVCDTTERGARAAIGMPARHPERITAELPGGQEEWLAAYPDHPDAAEIRQDVDEHRSYWLRGYRVLMGFAYLTLIPVG